MSAPWQELTARAAENVDLAWSYFDDGALHSAARILRLAADQLDEAADLKRKAIEKELDR